jgi:hypothetical protein
LVLVLLAIKVIGAARVLFLLAEETQVGDMAVQQVAQVAVA